MQEMDNTKKILVVDNEEGIRFTLDIFLREEGYEVGLASNYDEAVALMTETQFDLLFIDIIMEGKSGIELLRTVKETNSNAQVIIITGAPSVDTAAEALRLGALDYIVKPIRQNDLTKAARLAFRHKKLSDEKDLYRSNIEAIFKSVKDGIVTIDDNMCVVDVNSAAVQLCGYRENWCGVSLRTFNNDCSGACIEILKDSLINKKSTTIRHIECRRKDRGKQIVSINVSPLIDRMGKSYGNVMVLRDETRLFHLEKNKKENQALNRLIGSSKEMRETKNLIKTLADVPTNVLITGESGTGKELAVEALHSAGDRSNGPLIKVNCGALADSILESELFGHEQGAYTGAGKDRIGRFQLADGGIIFLDEIGDISDKMQLQLLRVIETMSFEKVGSSKTQFVDVRVVAATNRDLAKKVARGQFRKDLYYRLKVVEICLPPLRDRMDDVSLLTHYMINKFNKKFNKSIKAVSSDVEKLFHLYPWPGNVRELENSLEHACILCNHSVITSPYLPADLQSWSCDSVSVTPQHMDQSADSIKQALKEAGGNKAKAARLLNISRRTIYRKMSKYNIEM